MKDDLIEQLLVDKLLDEIYRLRKENQRLRDKLDQQDKYDKFPELVPLS